MPESIGICTADLPPAGNEFQLFPAGQFRTQDGRPKDAPAWYIDGEIASRIIESFRAKKNPMVVDYEHQTVLTKDNGKPAPAAGWVHDLEWREGKGLFAVGVKWTDAAKASIQADEYRYISPVFNYDKLTGAVLRLHNAALTNNPALDGMESAVALRHMEDQAGELEALRKTLAASGQADAVAILENAIADVRMARESIAAAATAQAQLKAEAETLRQDIAKREIEDVVDEALKTGRLLPYQAEAACKIGAHDMALLKVMIDRPSIVPMGTFADRERAASLVGAAHLNDAELRMCELSGRTPEEFAALKKRFEADA